MEFTILSIMTVSRSCILFYFKNSLEWNGIRLQVCATGIPLIDIQNYLVVLSLPTT